MRRHRLALLAVVAACGGTVPDPDPGAVPGASASMTQAQHDGRIDYIELGTRDLPASRRFFESVFGWKFTDYGPDYTSFADGRLTGGFRADTAPGASPLVVLYATDLDATRGRVEAAGAKVFNEHSFPGGRRFHFVEPGGNELAIWSER
jgi:predicted enzyme related to lactoylglutathione lyase